MREVTLAALGARLQTASKEVIFRFACAFAPVELTALVNNTTARSISAGQASGAARNHACQARIATSDCRAQTEAGNDRGAVNALVNMNRI